jgi:hypothetical protein
MSSSYVDFIPCSIANGAASSDAVVNRYYQDAAAIMIQSPATLEVGHTYVLEINAAKDGSGNWTRLKDRDGNDAYVPAADCAAWYPELVTAPAWRITSVTGNQTALRTFVVTKHHTI